MRYNVLGNSGLFDTANVYAGGRSKEILGRSSRNLGLARRERKAQGQVRSDAGARRRSAVQALN